MPRRTGLGAWLAVLVLACSPAPTGSPPPRPSSSAALVSPSARPSDSPPPSAVTAAVPSEAVSATAATPIPAPELSFNEEDLKLQLREDARVDCRPRRTDLPDGALFGVECLPNDDRVARVGIYGFATSRDALLAYLARMSSAGVEPDSGVCFDGIPADTQWAAGETDGTIPDPDSVVVEDGQVLEAYRFGCFHDENGTANFRATCWFPTYVGVLGRTRDIGALAEWAWDYPDDVEEGQPGPPGICPYEPGLGELEVPLSSGDTP